MQKIKSNSFLSFHINIENLLSLGVVFVFALPSLIGFFVGIEDTGILNKSFIDIVKYVRWFFLFFSSAILFRRLNSFVFFATFSIIGFVSVVWLFFPDNHKFVLPTIKVLLSSFWVSLMIYRIRNYDYLLSLWRLFSYLITFMWLFIFFYFISNNLLIRVALADTYMSFSYAFLPFSLVLLNDYFENKNYLSLILFLILIVTMFVFGARGSIVCIATFIFIRFIRVNIILTRNYPRILVVVLTGVVFLIFLIGSLSNLALLLKENGISSRMLNILNAQEFTIDSLSSGRNDMYARVFDEVCDDPLSIRGINSDYNVLGVYSHNIILEILHNFGVLLSLPLLFCIMFFSFTTIFCKCSNSFVNLRIIMFCLAIPRLLVSSSLWVQPFFWFWIFLSIKRQTFRW